MPSAKSVPQALRRLREPRRGRRVRARRLRCARPPRPARAAPTWRPRVGRCSRWLAGPPPAPPRSGRGRCRGPRPPSARRIAAVPCPPAAACSIALASARRPRLPGLAAPGASAGVRRDAAPGRRRDAVDLRDQPRRPRRSRRIHARAMRQLGEVRAAAARARRRRGRAGPAARRSRAALVVPHGGAGARGQPAPPQRRPRPECSVSDLRCALQGRGRGGTSVGDQQREAVEQQVERDAGARRRGSARTARQISRRTSAVRWRDAPATSRRAPRVQVGLARERRGRAARAAWRPSAAAGEHRCQDPRRTRPGRAAGRPGRAGARPAGRPPPWPAGPAPRRTPRPAGWPAPRPARARRAAPDRRSAPPSAPGTPRPRPARRGPAPARPSAPAPRRPPRPARPRPGPGARPGGPDRTAGSVTSASAACTAACSASDADR